MSKKEERESIDLDSENITETDADIQLAIEKEKRKAERLKILRVALYFGGGFYFALVLLIIVLSAVGITVESTELTILVTILGSSITTIIGVIAGSAID